MPNLLFPILLAAVTSAQYVPSFGSTVAPLGPAVAPFGRTISPFAPTLAPLGPNGSPFGPTGPLIHSAYYNQPGPAVPILTYSNDQNVDGSYAFSFSTADGKQVQESGYLKDAYVNNAGEPEGTHVVEGSYAYTAPDGTPIQVNYIADENGFRPQGVHIPAGGNFSPLSVPGTSVVSAAQDPSRYNNPYYNNRYNRFNQYDRFNRYNTGFNGYNNGYRTAFNGYDNGFNRYNNEFNRYNKIFKGYNGNSLSSTTRPDDGEKKN